MESSHYPSASLCGPGAQVYSPVQAFLSIEQVGFIEKRYHQFRPSQLTYYFVFQTR